MNNRHTDALQNKIWATSNNQQSEQEATDWHFEQQAPNNLNNKRNTSLKTNNKQSLQQATQQFEQQTTENEQQATNINVNNKQ